MGKGTISRFWEAILPLYSSLVKHIWNFRFSSGLPSKKHGLECVQLRAAKMIKVLERLLYTETLRELGLFSLKKRRVWVDLRATFKYLKGFYKNTERDFTKSCSARTREGWL